MSDMLLVVVAGNLRHDVQIIKRRGQAIAVSQLCTARSEIVDGELKDRTTIITVEVPGNGRAYEFQRHYRRGSRILIKGFLEERRFTRQENLQAADGSGPVLVNIERRELALVIETILDAGGIMLEQPDNGQQHDYDQSHYAAPTYDPRLAAPAPAAPVSATHRPLQALAERAVEPAAPAPAPASAVAEPAGEHAPPRAPWDWGSF